MCYTVGIWIYVDFAKINSKIISQKIELDADHATQKLDALDRKLLL